MEISKTKDPPPLLPLPIKQSWLNRMGNQQCRGGGIINKRKKRTKDI
jgi:hypothetical protein